MAEFDRFADDYLQAHAENLKLSGEGPEYFARHKIDEIRRVWTKEGRAEPSTILDFGAGIGNSLPHFHRSFPDAEIIALDVSTRSLAVAEQRFGSIARYEAYDGAGPLAPDASVDLAFSACVFHHIEGGEHVELFRKLRRTLRPGGALVIFEHNPVNPVTRHIVATCPFDDKAVLLPSGVLQSALRGAGFNRVRVAYTGFFPQALAALRGLEPSLAWLPLGAQYYVLADG
jgi:ubiquinone/menaquinone biosynthesis C-methylase UbiE